MFRYSPLNFTERGMTLIELVMVIGITTVLLLVISTSIVNLYQINSYNIAQSYER